MILALILNAASSLAPALLPCPSTPNCVSTQATDTHAIAPLHYQGTQRAAMQRLSAIVRATPRATVVQDGPDMLRVEFRTRIFRFVDDAQFLFDDKTRTIHFRSASRIGHSDLGVNRRRMETIRKAFQAAAGGSR